MIICIDLDNCLFPGFGNWRDPKEQTIFEKNLTYLQTLIKEYYCSIHITSSWGQVFMLTNNGIDILPEAKDEGETDLCLYYVKTLNKYLGNSIKGVCAFKNREKYFKKLQMNNEKFMIWDDFKYPEYEGYIEITNGVISEKARAKIDSLLMKE